jgi:hypothetical protein
MLIESEHSMAREDREGSGIEMGFIEMPPIFLGKNLPGYENSKNHTFPNLADDVRRLPGVARNASSCGVRYACKLAAEPSLPPAELLRAVIGPYQLSNVSDPTR